MRVALAFLAFLAGCGRGLPAGSEPARTVVVAAPIRREAAIDVVPAELGDDAMVDGARVRRWGGCP